MSTIGDIINTAAQQYGLDPGYLARVAQIESSGNPNASNGSAKGLYQFIPSTAAHYGLTNPLDPVAASDAAGRLTAANAAALAKALGQTPTPEQLYLAHQQGASGAAGLLTHPNAPAASIVGLSAVTNNGGTPDMTAGQFAQLWARKYDGAKPVSGGASVAQPTLAQALPGVASPGIGPAPEVPVVSPAALMQTADSGLPAMFGPDPAAVAQQAQQQARRTALLQSSQGLFSR